MTTTEVRKVYEDDKITRWQRVKVWRGMTPDSRHEFVLETWEVEK